MLLTALPLETDPAFVSTIVDLLVGFLAGSLWLNLAMAARGAMPRVGSGAAGPRHAIVLAPIVRAALAFAAAVCLLGAHPHPLPHPTACILCFVVIVAAGQHLPPGGRIWWRLQAGPPAQRRDTAMAARAVARLAGLSATPSHARIGRMAHRLALRAGLGQAAADQLQAVAPLYDIGMAGLPHGLPHEAEQLDPTRRRLLQTHPVVGARILRGRSGAVQDIAAEVALCHHEHWDGSGYPHGLAGVHIPLGARIVAVADLFERMLSAGPGKVAWPVEVAGERLRLAAGQRLDPALTRLFLDDLPAMLALREHAAGPACACRLPARLDPAR